MGLETGTYLDDLVAANPVHASDDVSEVDDHIRLLKSLLRNTFQKSGGAVYDGVHTTEDHPDFERIEGISVVTHDDSAAYTVVDSADDSEAKALSLSVSGTLTANRQLVLPARVGRWLISNATSGGFSLNVKVSGSGTTIEIPNGKKALLGSNGTTVFEFIDFIATALTVIGNLTAAGVNFGGTTLANYVEDSFTPTIVGTSTAGAGTYSTQQGHYTRIGNLVFFNARLTWSAHTGSGNMRVGGLPISSAGRFEAVSFRPSNIALTASNLLTGYVDGTEVVLKQYATGGGADADVPLDTSATLHVTGHYRV